MSAPVVEAARCPARHALEESVRWEFDEPVVDLIMAVHQRDCPICASVIRHYAALLARDLERPVVGAKACR